MAIDEQIAPYVRRISSYLSSTSHDSEILYFLLADQIQNLDQISKGYARSSPMTSKELARDQALHHYLTVDLPHICDVAGNYHEGGVFLVEEGMKKVWHTIGVLRLK